MEEANGRKRYLPETRVEIMKQHLLEKKTLSDALRVLKLPQISNSACMACFEVFS